MKPMLILRTLYSAQRDVHTPPLTLAVLGAAGRIGFRNWQQQECGRGGFEWRRGYRRRVDLLFVI